MKVIDYADNRKIYGTFLSITESKGEVKVWYESDGHIRYLHMEDVVVQPDENSEKIELTKERYQELTESEDKLSVLENAGVDNWSGYDIAMQWLDEDNED